MICINKRKLFVSCWLTTYRQHTTHLQTFCKAKCMEPVSVMTWKSADMSLFPCLGNWNGLCIATCSISFSKHSFIFLQQPPSPMPPVLIDLHLCYLGHNFCPFSLAFDQIYVFTNIIFAGKKKSKSCQMISRTDLHID